MNGEYYLSDPMIRIQSTSLVIVTWSVPDGKLLSQTPIPSGENKWLNRDGSRFEMTVEADQQRSINLYDAKSGDLLWSIIPETNLVNRLLPGLRTVSLLQVLVQANLTR